MSAIAKFEKLFYKNEMIDPTTNTIHGLFEKQALDTPEKKAIIFDDIYITYEELNNKANQLANFLINAGLKQEIIAGVYIERGVKTIIAMLAILKAGGAFLLIDKNLPSERVKFIIANSCINYLLVEEDDVFLNNHIQNNNIELNVINIQESSLYSKHNPQIPVTGNNMAYAIYTSGTTGHPKGVIIEHKGIVNTLLNQIEILQIDNDDKILCISPLSFDSFIWEIGGALLAGAQVYLTTTMERSRIRKLGHLIEQHEISIATITPSVLRIIPAALLSNLRILISAGEACTLDLIKKCGKKSFFYNAYGPTESSVCATIGYCKIGDKSISLGLPLKNTKVYVLTDDLEKTKAGDIGTLYISGLGLARGYLNNDELTNRFFINNPFEINSTEKLYNTGDLVCANDDGSLNFIGRKDREVKIRGNRVNLNEVQCLLSQYPRIQNSLVSIDRGYKNRKNKIIATIETDDESIDFKAVRNYLLRYLPSYMLPSRLIKTKQLSLTYNGKLDIRFA